MYSLMSFDECVPCHSLDTYCLFCVQSPDGFPQILLCIHRSPVPYTVHTIKCRIPQPGAQPSCLLLASLASFATAWLCESLIKKQNKTKTVQLVSDTVPVSVPLLVSVPCLQHYCNLTLLLLLTVLPFRRSGSHPIFFLYNQVFSDYSLI